MITALAESKPLICPKCGSAVVILIYSMPVHVLVERGVQHKVLVKDEDATFTGNALCRSCGESFTLDVEPDIGTWHAWEVGS